MKQKNDFGLLEIITQYEGLNQYMLENYDCKLSNDDLRTILSVWKAAKKNTAKKIINLTQNEIDYYKHISVKEGDLSFEEVMGRLDHWMTALRKEFLGEE